MTPEGLGSQTLAHTTTLRATLALLLFLEPAKFIPSLSLECSSMSLSGLLPHFTQVSSICPRETPPSPILGGQPPILQS